MASQTGPYLDRSGLVFYYDTRNTNESFKGRPTTNYIGNGNFWGGAGIENEYGSWGTYDIVSLKNPGRSSHVLRQQTGEYEIHFKAGTSIQPNTTYCQSVWVAYTSDWNGGTQIQHSRYYNGSGAGIAIGGAGTVAETREIDGLTWERRYSTFTTQATVRGDYYWYLGYSAGATVGYRYLADVQLEVGSYPSQFIDGTRSSTESVIDFTGNYSIDAGNVSFVNEQLDFDGTDDYLALPQDYVIKSSGGWTVESLVKYDAVPGGYNNATSPGNFIGSDTTQYNSWYWSVLNSKLALWNISPGIWRYGSTTLQPNTWYHTVLVCSDSGTQYQMYLNGVAEGGDHTTYSWNASYSGLRVRYFGIGRASTTRRINGQLPMTRIYNRALSADEVAVNASMYKSITG